MKHGEMIGPDGTTTFTLQAPVKITEALVCRKAKPLFMFYGWMVLGGLEQLGRRFGFRKN